jgi:hypothetical protein
MRLLSYYLKFLGSKVRIAASLCVMYGISGEALFFLEKASPKREKC